MSFECHDKVSREEPRMEGRFYSNIGTNLLQKMGWSEGKGLGKEEDGIKECIRVSKRSDNLGLGASLLSRESSIEDWRDWWNDAYNGVASKLCTSVVDSRYQDLSIDSVSTDSECGCFGTCMASPGSDAKGGKKEAEKEKKERRETERRKEDKAVEEEEEKAKAKASKKKREKCKRVEYEHERDKEQVQVREKKKKRKTSE